MNHLTRGSLETTDLTTDLLSAGAGHGFVTPSTESHLEQGQDLIEQLHFNLELLEDMAGRFRVVLREITYRTKRLAPRAANKF